jgi:biotin carboxyl carrier protein
MDTKTLSDFIAWSQTTDLQEITYKKGVVSFEIKTAQANPRACDFSCSLTPVKAPAVGVYQAGKKGKAVNIKENMQVKEGDTLGCIIMNNTAKEVVAPCSGTLKIISTSEGKTAEYGTPLFFIEPKK